MNLGYIFGARDLSVIKPDTGYFPDRYMSVDLKHDTLIISGAYYVTESEGWTRVITRIKGRGAVSERFCYQSNYAVTSTTDRLLYFYNGQDTVYKAD